MSNNPSKGTRLYLVKRKNRKPVYVIRQFGKKDISTRFGVDESERANQALKDYLTAHFQPDKSTRELAAISIGEVLELYVSEKGPTRPANTAATMGYHIKALLPFWADLSLADIKGAKCRAYVKSRPVKPITARHELKELQTAINYWHKEVAPLSSIPQVTLPSPAAPRERYLERHEAAALLKACRRLSRTPIKGGQGANRQIDYRFVARFILIGLYSGTRHEALLRLTWHSSLTNGYVDTRHGILYRRGSAERETNKRRPPFTMGLKLAAFVERWKAKDLAAGKNHLIENNGALAKLRRPWNTVVKAAGLGPDVTPHVLRHTFATWQLWAGKTTWEVGGMMGADSSTVERIYGHHRKIKPEERKHA